MITTNEIEKAIDFLVKSASEAGQSRANRIYLEEFRKSLKAQIMSHHQELPVNAQEREAYKDEQYIQHLDAMKTAIQEDEKMRFLIEAAKVKISVWQTMEKMKVNL
jgi:ABC-type transport system involved in cytochrome c biogenesis ATPase subunit